jgi:hypothetical protein
VKPVSPDLRVEEPAGSLAVPLLLSCARFVFDERIDRYERWRFSGSEARDARCESWCSVSGMGGGSGKLAGREDAVSPISWWPVTRLKVSMVDVRSNARACCARVMFEAGGIGRQEGPSEWSDEDAG